MTHTAPGECASGRLELNGRYHREEGVDAVHVDQTYTGERIFPAALPGDVNGVLLSEGRVTGAFLAPLIPSGDPHSCRHLSLLSAEWNTSVHSTKRQTP